MAPRSQLKMTFQALATFWTRTTLMFTSTAYAASYPLPALSLESAWVNWLFVAFYPRAWLGLADSPTGSSRLGWATPDPDLRRLSHAPCPPPPLHTCVSIGRLHSMSADNQPSSYSIQAYGDFTPPPHTRHTVGLCPPLRGIGT